MMTQGNRPLTLEEAQAKIEELIAERPSLGEFQKQIDERLSKCRNLEERMYLLFKMMTTNLVEMKSFYKDLEEIIKEGV